MVDANHSPLQSLIQEGINRSGRARDHFDSLLQSKLGTKGKPIYDIMRGKSKNPSGAHLAAIGEVLDIPIESLMRAAAGIPLAQSDHAPTRTADAGETTEIVQLDLSLSMGPGTLIDDFVESEQVKFDIAMLRKITRAPFERLRLVTGIGNSHEPKFHHNDQFLIDINERQLTRIDGYYWITLHGAHALKRLRPIGKGRIQVISENPDFDPQEVDAEDIRIEGRAIWVSRGL